MAQTKAKPPVKWTVMIYMAANDRTSDAAARVFLNELEELGRAMVSAQQPPLVNIVLQAYLNWNSNGGEKDYRIKRFAILPDFDKKEPIDTLDADVSMGDGGTLSKFIAWSKENFPAEKYVLLLWGHGTGSGMFQADLEEAVSEVKPNLPGFSIIHPVTNAPLLLEELLSDDYPMFNNPEAEAQVYIKYADPDQENKMVTETINICKRRVRSFRSKNKFYLKSPNSELFNQLRQFIISRPNLDGLVGRELNKSLEKNFETDPKLDLLVVMGCCMQMVEFGYEIREYCRYYVASEELMFFDGYNYHQSFLTLINNPDMNAEELGQKIVQDTIEKSGYSEEEKKYIAISCVDLRKSEQLARSIHSLATEMLECPAHLKDQIRHSRNECSHFGERSYSSSFIDITWFLKRLLHNISDISDLSALRTKIKELISLIEDEYIVQAYIGENKKPKPDQLRSLGGHGVAIYFPDTEEDHKDDEERGKYFNRTETDYVNSFSAGNRWNEMIFDYMKEAVP